MASFLTRFLNLTVLSLIMPLVSFSADYCGKLELSPAYIHIDVLESGKTIHRMDLGAIKCDANWRFWKALLIKPTLLYGIGRGKDEAIQTGAGLGLCLPYKEKWLFIPSIGVNWGWIKTQFKADLPILISGSSEIPSYMLMHMKFNEKFRSISPYVSLETCYTFAKGWRAVGSIQYSYSRTHTIIKPLIHSKSHSEGFSYSAMIEHDINQQWSINVAGAYNLSLTKEKHGMRIWGYKIGLAYWF